MPFDGTCINNVNKYEFIITNNLDFEIKKSYFSLFFVFIILITCIQITICY